MTFAALVIEADLAAMIALLGAILLVVTHVTSYWHGEEKGYADAKDLYAPWYDRYAKLRDLYDSITAGEPRSPAVNSQEDAPEQPE
jgi:hypothetical protein